MDWNELYVVHVADDREAIQRQLRYASSFAGGTENYSWAWEQDGALFGFKVEAARDAFRTWVAWQRS